MTDLPHQLKILFATFPPPAGDVVAQLEAYSIALEGHDLRDITAAVSKFIRGEAAGHNPAFAPSAAMVGSIVRECMTARLDSERRARRPALPPPTIEHSPESVARVKALVAKTTRSMAGYSVGDADGDRDVA